MLAGLIFGEDSLLSLQMAALATPSLGLSFVCTSRVLCVLISLARTPGKWYQCPP